jgi:hypothetical protein
MSDIKKSYSRKEELKLLNIHYNEFSMFSDSSGILIYFTIVVRSQDEEMEVFITNNAPGKISGHHTTRRVQIPVMHILHGQLVKPLFHFYM